MYKSIIKFILLKVAEITIVLFGPYYFGSLLCKPATYLFFTWLVGLVCFLVSVFVLAHCVAFGCFILGAIGFVLVRIAELLLFSFLWWVGVNWKIAFKEDVPLWIVKLWDEIDEEVAVKEGWLNSHLMFLCDWFL